MGGSAIAETERRLPADGQACSWDSFRVFLVVGGQEVTTPSRCAVPNTRCASGPSAECRGRNSRRLVDAEAWEDDDTAGPYGGAERGSNPPQHFRLRREDG